MVCVPGDSAQPEDVCQQEKSDPSPLYARKKNRGSEGHQAPGPRPWNFFSTQKHARRAPLSSRQAAVYSDFAPMGAASSSEVVAEKLREMGEGAAQRP